jgi:hypothetical protein
VSELQTGEGIVAKDLHIFHEELSSAMASAGVLTREEFNRSIVFLPRVSGGDCSCCGKTQGHHYHVDFDASALSAEKRASTLKFLADNPTLKSESNG